MMPLVLVKLINEIIEYWLNNCTVSAALNSPRTKGYMVETLLLLRYIGRRDGSTSIRTVSGVVSNASLSFLKYRLFQFTSARRLHFIIFVCTQVVSAYCSDH